MKNQRSLYGSAVDRFMPLVNGLEWTRTVYCPTNDCAGSEQVQILKSIFSGEGPLTDAIQERTLPEKCKTCSGPLMRTAIEPTNKDSNFGVNFDVHGNDMLMFDEHEDQMAVYTTALSIFPDEIDLAGETYYKAMVEVHKSNHFTSFVNFRNQWFHFDPQK
jgi:hypothetical protein